MKDRFDLEAEIHNVWDTEKDLDTILYRMMDGSEVPSEDEITNMLMGLKEIHSSRCMKLWDVFEGLVKNKCFKHPDEKLLGFATDKEAGFEATKMPMSAPVVLEDEKKSDNDLMGDKNWRDYVSESLKHPQGMETGSSKKN